MTTTEPLTLFTGPTGNLDDRTQILVRGPEAETFLQSIFTADLASLETGILRASALLSPQGKIQFDFLISRIEDGFRIDIAKDVAEIFAKRLTLYRLRAKAEIIVLNESIIRLSWKTDSGSSESDSISLESYQSVRDERFPEEANVLRHYAESGSASAATQSDRAAWAALRIRYGIAEGGADFIMNDVFPHDINFEQFSGVSFKKGCFVGQEVVSRMQHRGTARRRILQVTAQADLPAPDTPIIADGKEVGTLRSVNGSNALALVRIDRVKDAMDKNIPLLAGETEVTLTIPAYAKFTFPEGAAD
ncbi:folate-binding protein YgfZ [Pseudochrobactrum sp. Wa41.01b-1]|uniref:CAF17-like 4Fe-4S cluster assembly/insertion protein YgfZ n=1 Tax=Pseudochrobactrum sp. Wa41.01b-1 TaxID=2864102 RepID=UPI001C68DFB8|nr:folate-binding protein YgfZ [Pseudochrobactrum sp. Wa41.01b-1]QYM72793.1 folate-binding protein YgfZ [Pseudochrobactrum sp. Wa41.01b-1]